MRISKDPYLLSSEEFHCFVHSCLSLVKYCWGWGKRREGWESRFQRISTGLLLFSRREQKVMVCVSPNRLPAAV